MPTRSLVLLLALAVAPASRAAEPSVADYPSIQAALDANPNRILLVPAGDHPIAEPIRIRVVQALQHGERCVCDLTGDLDLAQSKLSFHLKVLKEAGLIRARQEGRWVYYRLEPSALTSLQAWLGQLAAGCRTPAPPCC